MYMFLGCTNLKKLDLSSFDTRNVTNMIGMFSNCRNLMGLDLSFLTLKKWLIWWEYLVIVEF